MASKAPKKPKDKKIIHFSKESLQMTCEWADCREEFISMLNFLCHVGDHISFFFISKKSPDDMNCQWNECGYLAGSEEEFRVHVNYHAFHTKIKSIGANLIIRKEIEGCALSTQSRNMIPELPQNLVCSWTSCVELYDNPELFYRHVDSHVDDSFKGTLICQWEGCQASFPAGYRLKEHLRSHTQEKMIACKVCGSLFSSRTKFWDHLERQIPLEDQKYRCSHCSKVLASERLLRDHMRNHINHYKCPHCDMTCATPSNLNNHMKYRHTTERPFMCNFCEYKGKSPQDVCKHMKSHLPDAFTSCPHDGCSYKTRSDHSLTLHLRRKHDDSQKKSDYVCHLCEKRFMRGSYLTRHLKKSHDFRWPSGHCRFRYKRNDDGNFQLQTVRYESIELTHEMIDRGDGGCGSEDDAELVEHDAECEVGESSDVELVSADDTEVLGVEGAGGDNGAAPADEHFSSNTIRMTITTPDGKSHQIIQLVSEGNAATDCQ